MEFNEAVRFSRFKGEVDDDALMHKIRWLGWLLINPQLKTKISDPKTLYKLISEQKAIGKDNENLKEISEEIDWDKLNKLY